MSTFKLMIKPSKLIRIVRKLGIKKALLFIVSAGMMSQIRLLIKPLKIDPIVRRAWYYRCPALSKSGRYNDSIKCYDEFIKLLSNLSNPGKTEAMFSIIRDCIMMPAKLLEIRYA